MSDARKYGAVFGARGGAGAAGAPCLLASPGEDGGAAHGAGRQTGPGWRDYGAGYGAATGMPVDAQYVIARLEEAGQTLLALPNTGYTTHLRTGGLEIVRTAAESYGWTDQRIRPAIPPAARITRMDEAWLWIPLIPRDRVVLRRIVGARSLVSPVTERHMFTWRRLGTLLGADHKAIQRWHAQGIAMILEALA
jgi:hypothetical protein